MKELFAKISDLIRKECEAFQLFITGSEIEENGNFIFYMDSEEPLNMKVLTEFTRHISVLIDEGNFDDTPFTFEISSPGADRPLTDFRQFQKHVGRKFQITTNENEEFEAQLLNLLHNNESLEKEWNLAAQIQLTAQIKAKPKVKPQHKRFEEEAPATAPAPTPQPKIAPVPQIIQNDFPVLLLNKLTPMKGRKINQELVAIPYHQIKKAIIIISFK